MATNTTTQQRFAERIFKYSQQSTSSTDENGNCDVNAGTCERKDENIGHACKYRGRVPQYSRLHGQVPRLYVQEWKTDMKNRELIIKNAELGGVPHYEHDENLFLDKREQMHYNVEDCNRVDAKCQMPDRELLLRPPFHHETSRYQSELMFRRDLDAQ